MDTVTQVNPIIEFLYSREALILAVVALLGAIASLIKSLTELIDELKNTFKLIRSLFLKQKKQKEANMQIKHKTLLSIIFLLLIIPIAVFTVRATDIMPPNVRMMKEVWGTFNKAKESKKSEDYHKAIEKAEILIQEFEPGAEAKQRRLLENKVKIPKDGKLSKEEKETVFDFGPLHEVSAAWWVKGRSLEALRKTQEAIQAYEKAAQYPHALVYDPSWDGFWSPAQDAEARAKYIRERQ